MKVGILVTGDSAVRAGHSLAAHPGIEVVVIGPATSQSFKVVPDASGCDLLVGSGPDAPARARQLGVPLLWDGEHPEPGVAVYGASPEGLALAAASRETTPSLVAVVHPESQESGGRKVSMPRPIGRASVDDISYAGHPLTAGKTTTGFASVMIEGPTRQVAFVDDAPFLAGIALAAGIAVVGTEPVAVWEDALPYLQTATAMGLVMAESPGSASG